jgi:hypothetical protein
MASTGATVLVDFCFWVFSCLRIKSILPYTPTEFWGFANTYLWRLKKMEL